MKFYLTAETLYIIIMTLFLTGGGHMIKGLEIQMWESAANRDSKGFLRLVDENAVMICGGYRCSGAEYAAVIGEFDCCSYDISDFEIVYENDGIAQVCYIIETKAALPENADLAGRFYITSTWKKQADGFKLIFNMDQRIK